MTILFPQFNFPEEISSTIGCTIAKKVRENLRETVWEREREFERERESLREREFERERESEKQGRGNDFCHFSDLDFLPCYLCKYPNIFFQNKNGIFQHKDLPINSGMG